MATPTTGRLRRGTKAIIVADDGVVVVSIKKSIRTIQFKKSVVKILFKHIDTLHARAERSPPNAGHSIMRGLGDYSVNYRWIFTDFVRKLTTISYFNKLLC